MRFPTVRQLVATSQLVLLASLVVCTIRLPQFLFRKNEGGVSNFGVNHETVVFYSVGFVVAALLLIVAANKLRTMRQNLVATMYALTAILYLLNLVSTYTYKLTPWLGKLHNLAAVILLTTEMIIGAWLVFKVIRDPRSYGWFALQCLGFVLLFATFFGWLHILFIAEVLTTIGYSGVLVRAASPQAPTKVQ